jgi:hypothetical protein
MSAYAVGCFVQRASYGGWRLLCAGMLIVAFCLPAAASVEPPGSQSRSASTDKNIVINKQATGARMNQVRMNQETMERYVIEHSDVVQHQPGYVLFVYNTVQMALVSDVKHDRMRIISPIARFEEVDDEHRDAVMGANFHSALDARYAVSNGVMYSAYIHPLSPLTEQQLLSAMEQVSNLVLTYGDQYSSGELIYGGVAGENDEPDRQ